MRRRKRRMSGWEVMPRISGSRTRGRTEMAGTVPAAAAAAAARGSRTRERGGWRGERRRKGKLWRLRSTRTCSATSRRSCSCRSSSSYLPRTSSPARSSAAS
uniref:Uncharacterized protein n=1 Tax=Arundo donax TaxID=35708 RepID=A0A0A9ECE5_ARUDO